MCLQCFISVAIRHHGTDAVRNACCASAADRFDYPSLPGEIVTIVNPASVPCGTEVGIGQEGVPDVIPPGACYLGWQESLALRVEAEIPEP